MTAAGNASTDGAGAADAAGDASAESPRVFAIVPAAGRSRRMGTAKQLLDVGGRPMLLAVVEPLEASRVSGVVVVTHRELARQVWDRLPPGVLLAENDDERSDMIDSVRRGLATWRARTSLGPRDGVLVCPGDHPGISTADFDACLTAFRAAPDRIVIAAREGRRGHPIIFPAALAAFVDSPKADAGLRALPREYADRVLIVERASPGITRDVDTPEDYDSAR